MISVVILYISTHKSTCQTDSFFTSYKNLIYLNIQFIKYYIKYTFPYHCFFYKKILTNIIVCENKFTLIKFYTPLTHAPSIPSFAPYGKLRSAICLSRLPSRIIAYRISSFSSDYLIPYF